MPKLTAIYTRVSTGSQDIASQLPELERWVAANTPLNSKVAWCEWFTDIATGKTMHRPGWVQLESRLVFGEIDTVVVWRLDRLGRTVTGLTRLFEDFTQRGIRLVSIRDGLDLSTPAGRLMANVLASVAQYETEVRAERVAAGQARAKAAGKKWGGWPKGKARTVSKDTCAAIRDLYELQQDVTTIARRLHVSRPTVYRVLGNLPAQRKGARQVARENERERELAAEAAATVTESQECQTETEPGLST